MKSFFTEKFILKFLKFGVVGFTGLLVDFGVTFFCKEILKLQKYLANAIGFTIAATTNYFLNRIWTFQSHNPEIIEEYGLFIGISLIGLLINTFILWLIITKWKVNFYISKAFAIGVVTIWNFLANYFITFS
ncbi:MAG: GtrA family protein [Bacteroidales bacterium]